MNNVEDSIQISKLNEYILTDITSIPTPLLYQQTISVLRHFFDQTQCYQYLCRRIALKTNQTQYEITDYPTGYWPERIFSIRQYVNEDDKTGNLLVPGYDFTGEVNPVRFKLATIPTANQTNALEVTLVLLPEFSAVAIPLDIFNRFYEVIASGIKARCQAMPKKPWSNPQQAIVNQQLYDEGINNARLRVSRTWTNKTLFAKPAWRFA